MCPGPHVVAPATIHVIIYNWFLIRGEEPQLMGKQWVPTGEAVFTVRNSKRNCGVGLGRDLSPDTCASCLGSEWLACPQR